MRSGSRPGLTSPPSAFARRSPAGTAGAEPSATTSGAPGSSPGRPARLRRSSVSTGAAASPWPGAPRTVTGSGSSAAGDEAASRAWCSARLAAGPGARATSGAVLARRCPGAASGSGSVAATSGSAAAGSGVTEAGVGPRSGPCPRPVGARAGRVGGAACRPCRWCPCRPCRRCPCGVGAGRVGRAGAVVGAAGARAVWCPRRSCRWCRCPCPSGPCPSRRCRCPACPCRSVPSMPSVSASVSGPVVPESVACRRRRCRRVVVRCAVGGSRRSAGSGGPGRRPVLAALPAAAFPCRARAGRPGRGPTCRGRRAGSGSSSR